VRPVLFDHMAIAVPRLADAEPILAGQLGGRSTLSDDREYRFWHWRYDGAATSRFWSARARTGSCTACPPEVPGPSITLIGLRMSVRSAERAHTQWGSVVGGARADDRDGTLVYRWPGSAVRIAVAIDPHRDQGPLCLEYSSRRHVALAAVAHPVLGAVFRRLPTG